MYDAKNQLIEIAPARQLDLTTSYYADGTVHTQTDAASQTTGYTYDSIGRVATVTDPLGNVTTYGYDGAGNQTSKQDPGGDCGASPKVGCTTMTYDAANQLATVTYSDGVTPNITSITYDADGQRTAMADAASGSGSWGFDSLHRMTSSTVDGDTTVAMGMTWRGT